jgi:hypothetical protein
MRFEAMLRGGFDANFEPQLSGVYELTANVVADFQGCYQGPPGPQTVRYGVGVLAANQSISVFTAIDVNEPALYVGNVAGADLRFSAIERAFALPGPSDVSMMGQLITGAGPDPVRMTAQRDVYDPLRGCSFTLALDGARLSAP